MKRTILDGFRNNDEKEKSPAATAIAPGPVSHNPIKGNENMQTHNTAPDAPAIEQPWEAVRRLSRELCDAMREDEHSREMVMIYADPAITHPIFFVHDKEWATISRLVFNYRDACRRVAGCPSEHLPNIIKLCEEEHAALLAAFEESRA